MTAKQHLRTLIKKLPDNCTVEDVMYELYVIQKIERGLASVEAGNLIPHEQVMKDVYACVQQSSGPRKRAKTSSKS
jgi:predicted transcriptional regulator